MGNIKKIKVQSNTYDILDASALHPSDVINDVTHTDVNKPLSANMGKELQDQITILKQRGRYLSIWNCTTGLAGTTPTVNPYTYKAGDYFIVGVVGASGATNYRPSGTQYDKDVPSTVVETGDVKVNDTYYYDGSSWSLLATQQPAVAFSTLAGQPTDNSALAAALNAKANEDDLKDVAFTASYTDLTGTPTLATVATSGNYDDLNGWPATSNDKYLHTNATTGALEWSEVSGGGDPDNSSINFNTQNKLQTIGVKNNNAQVANILKVWTGTLAQYNAISAKDPTTLYNITDDYSTNTIPSMSSSTSGKFLTNDGSAPSWGSVPDPLPSQSGQSGKFLTTNGSAASWESITLFPSQSGNAERLLTTNGSAVSWGPKIFKSTSEPSASDGQNGDIWIVYEE